MMRNGYRLLNTCAMICIVLTGAGRFLGIAGVSAVHILTAGDGCRITTT